MDPTFFEVTRTGEVLSRLTADTTLIQSIAGVGFSMVLRSLLQLPGALVMLAVTNLKLMGVIVLLIPGGHRAGRAHRTAGAQTVPRIPGSHRGHECAWPANP